MAQSQVFTGARAVLKINGQPIGYAIGCSGSVGINYQPLSVLGHLEVVEHVPVAYTVEFSANLARIVTSAGLGTRLADLASAPGIRSDVEGAGSSPRIMPAFGANGAAILTSGELTSTIYDSVSKKSLYTIQGVKTAQKQFDIQAGGMVAENATFVARIMSEDGESATAITETAAGAAAPAAG